MDLGPGRPLVEEVDLPAGTAATDLLLRICGAQGQELIRHAPEAASEAPLPEPKSPPPPPDRLTSSDELYLTGLHLEQYRHPTVDPGPYWEEALRLDPDDARALGAMGLDCLRRGDFAGAEERLRRAIRRLTHRNPNPRDGEPYYSLGLALKLQGRLEEAYDALYKATWSYAWQTAGYCALAEIDCLRQDFRTALEHLDLALRTSALNFKARNLKAAALRRLGRNAEAEQLVRQTLALDPLDFWARSELAFLDRGDGEELTDLMRSGSDLVDVQLYLDLAFDYAGAGLWEEAGDLLARQVAAEGAGAPAHPMVLYSMGYFAFQQGREEEGQALYRRAASTPPEYCFPWRLEELAVLRHVLGRDPDDARACYYLGNLLYDKEQCAEAIALWERACQLEPGFSIPWRNLGIAHYNVRREPVQAHACYLKAFAANPRDPRLLAELDQLMARQGESPEARLAFLEAHPDLVEQRDDLCVARAALCNRTGQPGKALAIIRSRRFHPWEGGEGRVSDQYVAACVALGQEALEAGQPGEALAHLEAALRFPDNLGEGRHLHAPDAQIHYLAGLARQALGDREGAAESFRCAAREQRNLSAMTYYQALALGQLGRKEEGDRRLRELLDFATGQLETAGTTGFDTSVPRFVFAEEAPRKRRRTLHTYLLGLAHLGLGQRAEAGKAFAQVVELDPHHQEARKALRRLSDASDPG